MASTKAKANTIVASSVPNPTDTFEVIITLPRVLHYEVRTFGGMDFHLEQVSAANLGWACVHGMGQRIPDGAAVSATDKSGAIIPSGERDQMKGERMAALIAHYETGTEEWERRADSGGGNYSLILDALSRLYNVDRAEAERKADIHAEMHFKGDRKKALTHLSAGKRLAEMMNTIRAERATKGLDVPDADDSLEELMQAKEEGSDSPDSADKTISDPEEDAETTE